MRRLGVRTRNHPPSHEEIQIAIPIIVCGTRHRATPSASRQHSSRSFLKLALARIQIKTITINSLPWITFDPSTHHEEIKIAIIICIEEKRGHILTRSIHRKHLGLQLREGRSATTIGLLVKFSFLPCRMRNIEILAAITIDVTHCNSWPHL